MSSVGDRLRRGPPLASIESLLSFEAKSTPRSEYNVGTALDEEEPLYTNMEAGQKWRKITTFWKNLENPQKHGRSFK